MTYAVTLNEVTKPHKFMQVKFRRRSTYSFHSDLVDLVEFNGTQCPPGQFKMDRLGSKANVTACMKLQVEKVTVLKTYYLE